MINKDQAERPIEEENHPTSKPFNTNVNIYDSLYDPSNGYVERVLDVLTIIKNGSTISKKKINKIRSSTDKKEIDRLKKSLTCIMFNGTFYKRSDDGLVKHSGLCIVDFDKYPTEEAMLAEKQKLSEDKYTFAVFISPSGKGLKALIKIPKCDKETHPKYFKAYGEYINSEYFDSANSNVSRVCFESYDPDLYSNQNSEVFDTLPVEVEPPKVKVKKDIVSNNSSVMSSSSRTDKYFETALNNEIAKLTPNGERHPKLATIKYFAQRISYAPHWEQRIKDDYLSAGLAMYGDDPHSKTVKKSLKDAWDSAVNIQVEDPKLEEIAKETKVIKSKPKSKGKGKEDYTVINNYLKKKYSIKLNSLEGVVEVNGAPINEFIRAAIMGNCSQHLEKNVSEGVVNNVITIIAAANEYNPIIEFINELHELPEPDLEQENEFDRFIDCFESNTDPGLLEMYFKRWMLGLFDLHVHNRMTKNVLVVSGKQNSCKTSLSKNILPLSLADYGKTVDFNINKLVDSKVMLCSLMVACYDEFEDILGNKSLPAFKNLTATYDIKERRAFRRDPEQMYRSALIMATTNDGGFLTDGTGNSRFLSIDMQGFNLEAYHKLDMTAVWRVILEYHKKGETSSLTESEREVQDISNEEFEADDPVADLIARNYQIDHHNYLTTTQIYTHLGELSPKLNITIRNVGAALKKLGYERKSRRDANGRTFKGYNIQAIEW